MITRLFAIDGNERQQVGLSLSRPAEEVAGEWSCLVEITAGSETLEQAFARGEDSLQALLLGVRLAKILLQDIQNRTGWRILWFGSPDLGLRV